MNLPGSFFALEASRRSKDCWPVFMSDLLFLTSFPTSPSPLQSMKHEKAKQCKNIIVLSGTLQLGSNGDTGGEMKGKDDERHSEELREDGEALRVPLSP